MIMLKHDQIKRLIVKMEKERDSTYDFYVNLHPHVSLIEEYMQMKKCRKGFRGFKIDIVPEWEAGTYESVLSFIDKHT